MNRCLIFSLTIAENDLKHLPEKSWYNHNYYEITDWNDYLIPGKCNILFEECDDVSDGAYYHLGYFEDEQFKSMFTWYENKALLKTI